ncbi:helix-turn-helix domain-containing protein [Lactiplantibacillus daowaiensis]|uniref:Helix-turn-helix domain-containing protein n=1 Tax=Lactiplantibacillus daowaiensis TaxID=2559918 RepID=A0ABW1S2F9_9LACO|nr:helix-turn-helix domain-containing protein [Lactiplantibacillus daowaiensis]
MFADYLLLLFATEPRRAKAIYNVCRGRRTVSTLFAGLTYQQLAWLDSWHGVPLAKFEAAAQTLIAAGWLQAPTDGYLALTAAGQAQQAELQQRLYQPVAWQQFRQADVRRFTALSQLALQVVSEYSHQTKRYYPVTTDPGVQATVKRWFRQWRKPMIVTQVVTELHAFLATLAPTQATIFMNSVTGYDFPGQTDQQLATAFKRTPVEILVMRKDLSCQLVAWLRQQPTGPLAALVKPLVKANPVSTSAWQTYQAFQQTADLSQIATQRRLKLSTVREHLLETAILTPGFPFETILTPELLAPLTAVFGESASVATWRFEQVQSVAPTLDFFCFRLYQIMRCQRATA